MIRLMTYSSDMKKEITQFHETFRDLIFMQK